MSRWRWRRHRTPPGPGPRPADPLALAVALVTESMRPDGGDRVVIDALLADVPAGQLPTVAAATALVAGAIAREWPVDAAAGPGWMLARLGLDVAARP